VNIAPKRQKVKTKTKKQTNVERYKIPLFFMINQKHMKKIERITTEKNNIQNKYENLKKNFEQNENL
jgi:hypothetical protein